MESLTVGKYTLGSAFVGAIIGAMHVFDLKSSENNKCPFSRVSFEKIFTMIPLTMMGGLIGILAGWTLPITIPAFTIYNAYKGIMSKKEEPAFLNDKSS